VTPADFPIDPQAFVEHFPELTLLVLHGSRARGDEWSGSDWDFAYRANPGIDELGLRAELSRRVGSDAVDVLDLDGAGGLVRYRVARDGRPLYEAQPKAFENFALAAIRFWLDASHALREGYAGVLESLGP
jgi:predicted nucleotidyltransferase